MISITESILIAKLPEIVYSFACDYRNDTRWRTGVLKMSLVPDEMPGLGSITHEEMKYMGQKMITKAKIVRCNPNHEVAFKVIEGNIPADGFRLVNYDSTGTLFTYHINVELDGIYKVLSPMMKWNFRKQLRKDLIKLKEIIENLPSSHT